MPWQKLNLVMVKTNATTSLEYVAAKGSYLYRSSQINGEFNNAQKTFQEIQTGDN
jgi:hypothetical protein